MRGLILALGTLAAGGLVLAMAHSASAHTTTTEDQATDVAERVAAALASHDPGVMRGEAQALAREGYSQAAQELDDEANRIDPKQVVKPKKPKHPQAIMSQAGQQAAAQNASLPPPAPPPPSPSPVFVPTSPAPTPTPTPTPTGIEDPGRALAQQMTSMLQSIGGLRGRGREDKGLVHQFQANEKLTADSKYGPGTATRVLQRYGIVPVAPFYWSKKNASTQKKAFIAFVRSYATGDPDRQDQYDQLISDTNRS